MVAATMLVICSVETGSVEEATSPASGASRSSFRTRSSSRLRTPSSTPMTSTRGSTRQACMQFMSRSGWGCSTAMASNGHGRRSVAVPVGVKEHLGPVERSALLPIRQQLGQPVDPVAVDASQPPLGDRSGAVGVASRGGQQRQLAGRRVRELRPDHLLLLANQLGGLVGDRQPPPTVPVLVVAVDQRMLAVAVLLEAIPAQCADLVRAAAAVDQELDRDAEHPPRRLLKP